MKFSYSFTVAGIVTSTTLDVLRNLLFLVRHSIFDFNAMTQLRHGTAVPQPGVIADHLHAFFAITLTPPMYG
ncbi:MAG: hypothetical protein AABY76_04180 [Planctomycetota bacterium]